MHASAAPLFQKAILGFQNIKTLVVSIQNCQDQMEILSPCWVPLLGRLMQSATSLQSLEIEIPDSIGSIQFSTLASPLSTNLPTKRNRRRQSSAGHNWNPSSSATSYFQRHTFFNFSLLIEKPFAPFTLITAKFEHLILPIIAKLRLRTNHLLPVTTGLLRQDLGQLFSVKLLNTFPQNVLGSWLL